MYVPLWAHWNIPVIFHCSAGWHASRQMLGACFVLQISQSIITILLLRNRSLFLGFACGVFIYCIVLDYIDTGRPISPRLGGTVCWFTNWVLTLKFFVVPVAVLIVMNAIFFISVWNSLNATLNSTLKAKTALSGRQYSVYLRMFLLMGPTWSTLLVAVLVDWDVIWYIFAICNASQGCCMFLSFGPETQWWLSLLDGINLSTSPKTTESEP